MENEYFAGHKLNEAESMSSSALRSYGEPYYILP